MNALGDVVLAEVPCISCGYNLRTQSVDGRCPECGAGIVGTLEKTLLLRGHSQIRRIAGAMRFAAYLNIGLVVVSVIFTVWPIAPQGLVEAIPVEAVPVLCFIGFAIYALLQIVVVLRTITPPPGERPVFKRLILITSGSCFVMATLAPLIMFTADAFSVFSNWPAQVCFGILVVCLPGLGVFVWTLGVHYTSLCTMGGFHRLAPWPRRIGGLLLLGTALLEVSFIILLLVFPDDLGDNLLICMTLVFYSGLLLMVVGLLAVTILLFVMSSHFRALAKTVGDTPLLTGPPPASTTTNAQ